jgi:uncharacterized protein YndB with AHSA1/START domain
MQKTTISAFLAAALAAVASLPASAQVKQIPVVRLEASTTIAAPPAAVWTWLTTGKNLVTWCPEWKAPGNAKVNLSKVGDVLEFTDQWGNGGRSIVTFLKPNEEVRVAHEPTDGSYLCQARVLLTPSGSGTTVRYIESYTDESAAKDLEATAAKVQAEMATTLASLKQGAEKK